MDLNQILKEIQNAKLFKAHPWHGISTWANKKDNILNVFIEIVPENRVKYELDKESGYLKIDRPQKFSNIIPALYGFIPRTYSKEDSSQVAMDSLKRNDLVGDEDPIDICILTDRHIKHGDILLEARPIGGFRMIDHGEVDDKIIAILKDDSTYGDLKDLSQVPEKTIESLRHYFLTYKLIPGQKESPVEIAETYDAVKAMDVIKAGESDYIKHFS
jgi:inorganic pyrophosphatase